MRGKPKKEKYATGAGGCTLPQEVQNWAARMSPQDQQACDAAIVSGLVSVAINQVHRLLPLSNELWGQACSDRNVRATQTHLARKRRSAHAGFTRVRIQQNEGLLHHCL